MRQRQYDRLHRISGVEVQHIPPASSLIRRPDMCLSQVSSSEPENLSLSGCEGGRAVADTEPAAFPANRIRGAAQTSVSVYLFRINPRAVWEGGGGAPMYEDYCF